MEPGLRAPEGLAACLHHLQSQKDAPSFIASGAPTTTAISTPRAMAIGVMSPADVINIMGTIITP